MQLDENGKTAAHCSGRIAYQSSSERTQERRWVEVYAVIDHLMSIAGGETALTHIMVDALGRGLAPMGHGGKAARALGKIDDILAALWARPAVAKCFEDYMRTLAKGEDHVQKLIETKIRGNATYRMVDAYRHLMLVPHASRGTMNKHVRQLMAWIYAYLLPAGDKWDVGDPDMEARTEVVNSALKATKSKASQKLRDKFMSAEMHRLAAEDPNINHRVRFATAMRNWKDAPENPNRGADDADADNDAAPEEAEAGAGAEAGAAADEAAETGAAADAAAETAAEAAAAEAAVAADVAAETGAAAGVAAETAAEAAAAEAAAAEAAVAEAAAAEAAAEAAAAVEEEELELDAEDAEMARQETLCAHKDLAARSPALAQSLQVELGLQEADRVEREAGNLLQKYHATLSLSTLLKNRSVAAAQSGCLQTVPPSMQLHSARTASWRHSARYC